MEFGEQPESAISLVRAVRGGAIETDEQYAMVLRTKVVSEPPPSSSTKAIKDRATGTLLGLAVGDAVGTTLEFMERDTYRPLSDMIGGGPFNLKAGEWTDDTAMALALADSLHHMILAISGSSA